MSSFTRSVFEPTGKTKNGRVVWRCLGGFYYEVGYLGSGVRISVPEGFETDGPSVPFWALCFMNVGKMVRSSAIHDMARSDLRFSKIEGDAFFLAAMDAEGTPKFDREAAFFFVRLNDSRN